MLLTQRNDINGSLTLDFSWLVYFFFLAFVRLDGLSESFGVSSKFYDSSTVISVLSKSGLIGLIITPPLIA